VRDVTLLPLRLRHAAFCCAGPDDTMLVRLLLELAALATSPHPAERPQHWTATAQYLDVHLRHAAEAATAHAAVSGAPAAGASEGAEPGSPAREFEFEFRFVRARHLQQQQPHAQAPSTDAATAAATVAAGATDAPRRPLDPSRLQRMAEAVATWRPHDGLAMRLLQALAAQEEEEEASGAYRFARRRFGQLHRPPQQQQQPPTGSDGGAGDADASLSGPMGETFVCVPVPPAILARVAGANALDADLGLSAGGVVGPSSAPPPQPQQSSPPKVSSTLCHPAVPARHGARRLTQDYCNRFDVRIGPEAAPASPGAVASAARDEAEETADGAPWPASLHAAALRTLLRIGYALPPNAQVAQSQAAALVYLDARCDDAVRAARVLTEAAAILAADAARWAAAATSTAGDSGFGGRSSSRNRSGGDHLAQTHVHAAAVDDAVRLVAETVARRADEATECIEAAATAQLLPPRVCARLKMALVDAIAACAARGVGS